MDVMSVSIICVTILICCLAICNAFGKKDVTPNTEEIAKTVVDGILSSTKVSEPVQSVEDKEAEEQFNNMLGEVNDLFGGVDNDDESESK